MSAVRTRERRRRRGLRRFALRSASDEPPLAHEAADSVAADGDAPGLQLGVDPTGTPYVWRLSRWAARTSTASR